MNDISTDQNRTDRGDGTEPRLPKVEVFRTIVPVMVNHLNYGNHVGYDSVLTILHEARMQWMHANNITEVSIDGPVGYIVNHASVDYLSEAFYGDELEVVINVDSFRNRRFALSYSIENKTTGKTMAQALTKHVFFDYEKRRIASCPDNFRIILEGAQK